MFRTASLTLITALIALLCASDAARAERGEHEEYRNEDVLVVGRFEPVQRYPTRLTIKGRVRPTYRFSEALLVRPDGSAIVIRDRGWDAETGEFYVNLHLNRRKGIYRLELTATTGKNRTHSGARILLFAGVPADHPDEATPEDLLANRGLPAVMIAADLFDRVNAHRESVGLEPVEWLEPLAVVARDHARDCVGLKDLDHTVNKKGTVVDRMVTEYGWQDLVYKRPRNPPTKEEGAKSYFPTMLEARKGIEPVLHRWKRFAAFCVPMTSEVMTHGACGIARTKGGTCYIVFAFAQVNGIEIEKDVDRRFKVAQRSVKNATDADRPAALRELGLWRRKASTKAAKKHLKAKDPALRGAAYDVVWMAGDEREQQRVRSGLDAAASEYERLARVPGVPRNRALPELQGVLHMTYDPVLVQTAGAIEALRQTGAATALAAALGIDADPDARRRAIERVESGWPGTEAAATAAAHLTK